MPVPGQSNVSQMARLLLGAPSFAVGWQEPIYIPDPAAGTAFSHTVDGRYYERLLAVTFNLVTSAAVANRFAELFLMDNDGRNITAVPCSGTVVAGTTLNVFLTADAPSYSGGNSGGTFGKVPDLLIPPGWKWELDVFAMDVADTINSAVLLVQRFPSDTIAVPAIG